MREKIVRIVAGSMVLLSASLTYYVAPQWLWLSVFVSFNLIQSSLTGFCPLEKLLDALKVS